MGETDVSTSGCGCCKPDTKTTADVVRELEERRDRLDERLRRLDLVSAR